MIDWRKINLWALNSKHVTSKGKNFLCMQAPNGSETNVTHVPNSHILHAQIMINRGHSDDPVDFPGAHHMIEHLLSNRLVNGDNQHFDNIGRRGGQMDASVNNDEMHFIVQIKNTRFNREFFLARLQEAFLAPSFDETSIAREIETLANENLLTVHAPYIFDEAFAAAVGHTYPSLKSSTAFPTGHDARAERLYEVFQRSITGDTISVGVQANSPPPGFNGRLCDIFAALPKGTTSRQKSSPSFMPGYVHRQKLDDNLCFLSMAHPFAATEHGGDTERETDVRMLTDYVYTRLMDKLRAEGNGKIYTPFCTTQDFGDTRIALFGTSFKPEHGKEVADVMANIRQELENGKLDKHALKHARGKEEQRILENLDNRTSTVSALSRLMPFTRNINYWTEKFSAFWQKQALNKDRILNAWNEHLNTNQCALFTSGNTAELGKAESFINLRAFAERAQTTPESDRKKEPTVPKMP